MADHSAPYAADCPINWTDTPATNLPADNIGVAESVDAAAEPQVVSARTYYLYGKVASEEEWNAYFAENLRDAKYAIGVTTSSPLSAVTPPPIYVEILLCDGQRRVARTPAMQFGADRECGTLILPDVYCADFDVVLDLILGSPRALPMTHGAARLLYFRDNAYQKIHFQFPLSANRVVRLVTNADHNPLIGLSIDRCRYVDQPLVNVDTIDRIIIAVVDDAAVNNAQD